MKETTTISISTGTIVKILMWVTIFAGLFYVSDFIIALLVSVVLASAVEMPVRMMGKWGIPRSVAVISIFFSIFILLAAVIFVFIPPLADDLALFIKTLPKILESVRIFGRDMGFKDLSLAIADLSRDISKGQILSVINTSILGGRGFFATTSVLLGGLLNFVLTFVIAFYLAAEERGVQKFLRLITPRAHQGYVEGLWNRSQKKISRWVQGQLLMSLCASTLVLIPLLFLHVQYAVLLAFIAFLGELVPIVGLSLAAIPALVLAFMQGGVQLLLTVLLVYFVVGQIDGHILYPKIMSKAVGVPSVIVIIALVLGAQFAGIWGVLISVPFASIFMEFINDVSKKREDSQM